MAAPKRTKKEPKENKHLCDYCGHALTNNDEMKYNCQECGNWCWVTYDKTVYYAYDTKTHEYIRE